MPTCRRPWLDGWHRRGTRRITYLIVTKDEDFVLLHALDRTGAAVVWVRIGNALRRVLLRRLPTVWPDIAAALERGEKVIEVS